MILLSALYDVQFALTSRPFEGGWVLLYAIQFTIAFVMLLLYSSDMSYYRTVSAAKLT